MFVQIRPADSFSYVYLLGMYLGDGYVAKTARSYQLVIALDAADIEIVEECTGAIVLAVPSSRPRAHRHPVYRAMRVTAGSQTGSAQARPADRPCTVATAIVERHTWQSSAG